MAKIQDLSEIIDDNLPQISLSEQAKDKLRQKAVAARNKRKKQQQGFWVSVMAALLLCVCVWRFLPQIQQGDATEQQAMSDTAIPAAAKAKEGEEIPSIRARGSIETSDDMALLLNEQLFCQVLQGDENTALAPAAFLEIMALLDGETFSEKDTMGRAELLYDSDCEVSWNPAFLRAAGDCLIPLDFDQELPGDNGIVSQFCQEGSGECFLYGMVQPAIGGELSDSTDESRIQQEYVAFSGYRLTMENALGISVTEPQGHYIFAAILPQENLEDFIETTQLSDILQAILSASTQINGEIPIFCASGETLLSNIPDTDLAQSLLQRVQDSLFMQSNSTDLVLPLWNVGLCASFSVQENGGFFSQLVSDEKEMLVFDRPFLYFLVDLDTGLPVLFGAVRQP